MQETSRIKIRVLDESDIPEAMKLKEAAGWNQTENDWRCLLKLEPQGCFGATLGGQLVGTTTTTTYGDELAWIGMVLVLPERRRLGIATKLLQRALDYLSNRVAIVKLDATPAGKPVYERLGFRVESMVERWSGEWGSKFGDNNVVETVDLKTRVELFEIDRRVFGADRSKLLQMLLDQPSVPATLARTSDGSLSGYALGRAGSQASYIGPLVTTVQGQAGSLLDRILAQTEAQRVYIDFNTIFADGSTLLETRGFTKERELIRMSLGTSGTTTCSSVFAIAGPELG